MMMTAPQVVVKGGEVLLSEAVKGSGGLLGSTFVDKNWERRFATEVTDAAIASQCTLAAATLSRQPVASSSCCCGGAIITG
jgi:phosphate/sulfate permease